MDYSQFGEGKIINEYFGDKGVLISLGENDGRTLSNVLGLIERGWKAYLVEPSEVPFAKLKELHKGNENVKCFNYAVGTYDGDTFFYDSGTHLNKGDTGLLSSTSEQEIKRWGKLCTFEKKTVKMKTWGFFKKDAKFRKADMISIDCEGVDFDILTQIDFNALKTKMVCVESNSVENEKYINYMFKFGFKLHYSNSCNLIFTK